MREIKFRAWDSNNDEMVYSSQEDCFYVNTKGVLFMYKNVKKEQYVKDYNVMQYTGLLDKNGVEIYEGDIVLIKEEDWKFEVKFNYEILNYIEGKPQEVEVIGNIWENKELLSD